MELLKGGKRIGDEILIPHGEDVILIQTRQVLKRGFNAEGPFDETAFDGMMACG